MCLADKEQYDVPDREEQRELLVAGLGEVKVAVPENAKEKDVRDLLTEIFPKLKDSGGFELMYVESRSKELQSKITAHSTWPQWFVNDLYCFIHRSRQNIH